MIGVFDSGVGGLSVLRELVRALPHEKFIYFSDNAHCPYGGKSAAYVIDRARWITDFLLGRGCSMIVIACNTATAAAVATLREEYPAVPFVGIEPAIKPAAAATLTGVVGVLATRGTLSGEKYHIALGRMPAGIRVVEHVGEGFVELVERGFEGDGLGAGAAGGAAGRDGAVGAAGAAGGNERFGGARETVAASVYPLLEAGADVLVLGCTHYPFLSDCISSVASEWCLLHDPARKISIIDPSPAVAKQAVRLYTASDGLSTPIVEAHASGDDTILQSLLQKIL